MRFLKLLRSPTILNVGVTILLLVLEYVVERRRERQTA